MFQHVYRNFNGWAVPPYLKQDLPVNALETARNILYDPSSGGMRIRPRLVDGVIGTEETGVNAYAALQSSDAAFTAALGASNAITTIARFTRRDGQRFTLLAIGNKLYHLTGNNGTLTELQSFTGSSYFSVVGFPFLNELVIGNGSGVYTYDGAAVSSLDQTGTSFDGRYLGVYQSALLGTIENEITQNVYFTSIEDGVIDTGTIESALSLQDEESGEITGISPVARDALLLYKTTGVWRYLGGIHFAAGQLDRISDIGCLAPRSLQSTPYGDVFMSHDGIYLVNPNQSPYVTEISGPLKYHLFERHSGSATKSIFERVVTTTPFGLYSERQKIYYFFPRGFAGIAANVFYQCQFIMGHNGIETLWSECTLDTGDTMPSCGTTWDGTNDLGETIVAGRKVSLIGQFLDQSATDDLTLGLGPRPLDDRGDRQGFLQWIKINGYFPGTGNTVKIYYDLERPERLAEANPPDPTHILAINNTKWSTEQLRISKTDDGRGKTYYVLITIPRRYDAHLSELRLTGRLYPSYQQ